MSADIRVSVELKYRKGNRSLFSRDSDCLCNLIYLIEKQKHRTLVMWVLDCAQDPLSLFEAEYPEKRIVTPPIVKHNNRGHIPEVP